WLNRWTLLDIFIVLIITLAVAHLYSRWLALLALLTLVLTWHEPQAPRWLWPLLLTGFALLKHLPEGSFKKLVRWGQLLLLLTYLVITIPFAVVQLRVGIYPQLEKPWQAMSYVQGQPTAPNVDGLITPTQSLEEKGAGREAWSSRSLVMEKKTEPAKDALSSLAGGSGEPYRATQVAQYDPKMQLQTGPGLPAWQWNTIALNWSGPVRAGQTISLWLLGPTANLVLAVARVLLLILLPLGLLGIGYRRKEGWRFEAVRRLFTLGLLLMFLAIPGLSRAADFPTPEMLANLQSRLLEKDKCFPDCSALEELDLDLTTAQLTLELTLAAKIESAIPLPGDARFWLPERVELDGRPSTPPLLRQGNTLWLQVPAGRHRLRLQGRLAPQATVQLPLPIPPRHLKIKARGWEVAGIQPDGTPEGQLQFKRIEKQGDDSSGQVLETGVLPPFLRVERTLLLGLA
ncbi:MAG TPA: hypothetical protein VKA04_07305, partial [Pseudodesulfovibrio sp.]|nr:hypothetical protein [Pseudodesulfovibrio sp.]